MAQIPGFIDTYYYVLGRQKHDLFVAVAIGGTNAKRNTQTREANLWNGSCQRYRYRLGSFFPARGRET
jgi:hypothetical protein